MPVHDVHMRQSLRLVGKTDVIFEVFIDGEKRGELHLSKGGVDWLPAHAKTNVRTKLAEFMES